MKTYLFFVLLLDIPRTINSKLSCKSVTVHLHKSEKHRKCYFGI